MRIATTVLIGLSLLATPLVFGANAQQEKMTTCNADAKAKSLTGDARKSFMKTCLSSNSAAGGGKQMTAQQQKMSTCSKDAAAQHLSGDDRKKFMSTCLKGK
jgi:hypothetical protein